MDGRNGVGGECDEWCRFLLAKESVQRKVDDERSVNLTANGVVGRRRKECELDGERSGWLTAKGVWGRQSEEWEVDAKPMRAWRGISTHTVDCGARGERWTEEQLEVGSRRPNEWWSTVKRVVVVSEMSGREW